MEIRSAPGTPYLTVKAGAFTDLISPEKARELAAALVKEADAKDKEIKADPSLAPRRDAANGYWQDQITAAARMATHEATRDPEMTQDRSR